ncbi:type II secretion system protein N [Stakelama saccharophila]|uniref:Type II secretion system protein N n=1 Tax=Stakelama saccharophila TaxID=3075605 RepID=A0ABZ0BCV7_9SPHN|nr:type II secretion system protein N [Stakelama sp. W311]WNO55128.1 type II secretion system protein N [Stakelama sp. W311]
MIATLPAGAVLKNRPWRTGISGTVWEGEVGVAGGSIVRWNWAPLRSLTSLGFAVDWRATGENTDLGGRALFRPGRMVVDKVSGSADATLLRALAPDLPFTCSMTMQVDLPRVALGGGDQEVEGQVAADPGSCAATGGSPAVPVPALMFTATPIGNETRMRLTPMAQRRREFVTATLAEDGTLRATMTPAGAGALPFAGLPAGASIRLD